jgi:hypothetical protein
MNQAPTALRTCIECGTVVPSTGDHWKAPRCPIHQAEKDVREKEAQARYREKKKRTLEEAE